jgi:hypothetical protein
MTRKHALAWLLSTVALGGALGGAMVWIRSHHQPVPVAAAPKRPLTSLEQAAQLRFANVEPHVRMPNGQLLAPLDAEHALQMKVSAYKSVLVREEEDRDPTFRLRAEAELARRKPMRAAIEWEDPSGNQQLVYTIEDTASCGLDGNGELSLAAADVGRYPCLDQGGNRWDGAATLKIHLDPIAKGESQWNELLRETMKSMAADLYVAQAGSPQQ